MIYLLPAFIVESMNAKGTLLGNKKGKDEQHGYGLRVWVPLKFLC